MMLLAIMIPSFLHTAGLPVGAAPDPIPADHFPSRVHAFVWRNWSLVPVDRMAAVLDATPEQVRGIGAAMGLDRPPEISEDQQRRSYITVIRRNWHLLPYDQLLELLGWSEEELAYCLREDDFLFVKLGRLKPKCLPLRYAPPDEVTKAKAAAVAACMKEHFPEGPDRLEEPLFAFVDALSQSPEEAAAPQESCFDPRYCYSYFALYGDPLLDETVDPYPDGYLARLAASGVNGVWLQGVLYKLAPFPWKPGLSVGYEKRLENLGKLVARAKRYGMGVYLYLNEPRSMPLSFFEDHPELKGVTEGDYATMCTSVPAVRDYLRTAVQAITEAVPDLAGFFTISGSENLTHCWSHHHGDQCPRCREGSPGEVVAELHQALYAGIEASGAKTRLIAWDWGWGDGWVPEIAEKLPRAVAMMSVSEWSIPIKRGGVDSVIGEYSISEVGPGPRATRHWALARAAGHATLAKVQVNNTWELSAVPYVPVVEKVAQHAAKLREANVDGLQLSWTLGGYPSPNLEAVAAMGAPEASSVDAVLAQVAEKRVGKALAPALVNAWKTFSAAMGDFPFHIGTLYHGPQQMGPANLLYDTPTGYGSTMVCFPYDDLTGWRSVYPPEIFAQQFARVADGFDEGIAALRAAADKTAVLEKEQQALDAELRVAEVCALHFRSVAQQCRFVMARDALRNEEDAARREPLARELAQVLDAEIALAKRLHAIQVSDSRFGFEASNHYFYVPMDLAEKVLNCVYLRETWLPAQAQ